QKLEEANSRNTWKNNSAPEPDREKKQDVSGIVDRVIDTIEGYFKSAAFYRERVPFNLDLAPADFPAVIEFMHFCLGSVGFPAGWVKGDDLKIYFDTAEEQKERKVSKIEFLAKVITHMGEDFLHQNADEKAKMIDSLLKKIQAELSEEYADEKKLLDEIDELIELMGKATERLKTEQDIINGLTGPLCVAALGKPEEVGKIAQLAEECSMDLKAVDSWFADNWGYGRDKTIAKAREMVRKAEAAKATVLEEYDKAVLEVDYAGIMARMDNEYTSFLRMITPQFKADMNALRVHRRQSTKKISYEEMFDILQKIQRYRLAAAELEANRTEFTAALGGWYNGEYTDFEGAAGAIERFEHIRSAYRGKIPAEIRTEMLAGRMTGRFSGEASQLNALVNDPELKKFARVIAYSNRPVSENIDTAARLSVMLEGLKDKLTGLLREFYSKETLFNCYDSLMSLSRLQTIERLDARDEAALKEMYGDLFKGGATDWKCIITKLEWVGDYIARRKIVKTNEAFDKGVASAGDFVKNTEEIARFLEAFLEKDADKVNEFDNLFSENENLEKKRLSFQLEKAKSYKDSLKKFDVKAAFSSAIDRFFDIGLGDYVNKLLQSRVKPEEYERVFMNGFEKMRSEIREAEETAAVQASEPEVQTAAAAYAENRGTEHTAAEGTGEQAVSSATGFGVFREFVYEKAAKGKTADKDTVAAEIVKIAQAQSPVHIDIVCRQLAPLYGYVKVTPKVKDEVLDIINTQAGSAYALEGDYLRIAGRVIPKLPEEGAKPRPIEKIAPDELAAAMEIIRGRDPEIKKDALIKAVAKEYGCTKLTAAIKKYISEA
nr:hypothetical protein [Lachnospiraceae bacterium]